AGRARRTGKNEGEVEQERVKGAARIVGRRAACGRSQCLWSEVMPVVRGDACGRRQWDTCGAGRGRVPGQTPPSTLVSPATRDLRVGSSFAGGHKEQDLDSTSRSFFRCAPRPARGARDTRKSQTVGRYAVTGLDIVTHKGVRYAYHRNREVVQRHQGLWLHHAGGREQGLLRPPLGDRGERLQDARRG